MNKFLKKFVACILVASSTVAPVATQVTVTAASRAGIVAAVGAVALAAPMSAHAQSGKRICGTVWGLRAVNTSKTGYVALAMEVSKYDPVTCTALLATWLIISGVPSTVKGFAQGLFNTSSLVGSGIVGNLRGMQTCEAFSSSIQANTGDVCLQMQDYKIYKFVKVFGGPFGMSKV